MVRIRSLRYFKSISIIALITISCNYKSLQITHLNFLDLPDQTYNIMDTLKRNPLKTMSLYYLVNQSKLKFINDKSIEEFIKTDSVIQKRIHENYSRLNVLFLKESVNTDNLLRFKSYKALTLCNDDMVVEYMWSDGLPSDTFYYENGQIKGFEKIKLYDLKNSSSK